MPSLLDAWKAKAEELEEATFILYLAARHPRTPWYAKALALLTTAYALSPIDLIPDFIPVMGALDDLVIVPLGAWLAIHLVPGDVLAECRTQAEQMRARDVPAFRWMAVVVAAIWVLALVWVGITIYRLINI